MRWFSMRQLALHPWRVLAVLCGIAIGAAVFTSVRLAVDASLESFTRTIDLISGKADWVVVRPGGRVPEGLVAELQRHPAIETASPLITSYVVISKKDAEPLFLIGLDPILDRTLRSWEVQTPSKDDSTAWRDLVTIPGTIFISQQLGGKLGLKSGGIIPLEHVHQKQDFKIVGVLEQKGLALLEAGNMGLVDIASMQEFTGLHGWVDRIDLRLKSDVTKKDLHQLRALLPPGIVFEAPNEAKESGQMMIGAYQLNLSLLSFVSLFVGMFLVYSLVSLNAASRRRELAILRSLGSSSQRIFGLVIGEGIFLGIIGWLLAIPIGSFLTKYLLGGISDTISNLFVRVHVEGLHLDSWEILLSFLVTVGVCLMAAYGPAREASFVSPREAMFLHEMVPKQKSLNRRLAILGLVSVLLSLPVSKLPGFQGIPLAGYLAVMFLIVGFYMMAPSALQWMGTTLPTFLKRLGGEPAFLGGRYLRDSGKRAAISVGALVTAVALFVSLVIMIHSFRHTVEIWVNQTVSGDLFLRAKMAGFNEYRDPLPEDVIAGIMGLRKDAELLPYRTLKLKQGEMPYELEITHLSILFRYGDFLLKEGRLEEISQDLIAGKGVIVSEVFANQTKSRIGDRYRLQLGETVLDVPILGVFRDYRTNGGIVFFALSMFEELTGEREWSGVRFFFVDRNQDLEAAAQALQRDIIGCCSKGHALEMISGIALREEILRIFDETFAVTIVLLLIALLVAGLGITTTLTVLVMERIRELNTLVAIGASHGQIRSMIFWEAVLMVTSGEVMGVICGFILSYLLIYVINLQSFGWTFLYTVNWPSLFLSLPLILGTALLAALPAIRIVLRSSPSLVLREV